MKEFEITEQSLKNGTIFHLDNQKHQEKIGGDDIRSAEVSFDDSDENWAKGFKIWFNGKLIHTSKTFKSLQNKLNELCDNWKLEIVEMKTLNL